MKKAISAIMALVLIFTFVIIPSGDPEYYLTVNAEAKTMKNDVPTGLKAVVSNSSVKLTWNKVSGAEGYRVYVYDSAEKEYKQLFDVKNTSCNVTNLTGGKTYYFKIAALKNGTAGKKSAQVKIAVNKPARSVSIDSLKWSTDYSKLTNVVSCKISMGDFISDLDGDGINEVINFTHIDKNNSKVYNELKDYPVIPYINGKAVKIVSDDDYMCITSPILYSGYFYVCDIDSADKYKEIAIVPKKMNATCFTYFYRYINGELKYIGEIAYDAPSEQEPGLDFCDYYCGYLCNNFPLLTDGTGIIKAASRLHSQTWWAYAYYEVNPITDKITLLANTPMYPYGYEYKDDYRAANSKYESMNRNSCRLTKDITVYAKPSFNSRSYTMKAQNAIPTGEIHKLSERYEIDQDYYLDNVWIYVTAEDGTSGWLYLGKDKNGEYINDEYELFTALMEGW